MKTKTALICLTLSLSACASGGPSTDSGTFIHPAAYGADGFMFDKAMPSRPARETDFYFKRCSAAGSGRSFYSRTDYECSYP